MIKRRELVLGVRLALGAPEARRRFAMTGVGVALAALFLLSATCVLPALEQRNERMESRTPSVLRTPDRSAGSLLVGTRSDRFHDTAIKVYDVAPLRGGLPAPPGLSHVPAPGEVVVSPRVRELQAGPHGRALKDRYPPSSPAPVTDAGLGGPGEAVVWRGVRVADFAPDWFVATGWGAVPEDRLTVPGALRLAVPAGVLGLLVPVLALVVSAGRWGTQERDRRMAALRLAGLTAGEVRRAGAVEAALAAAVGCVGGLAAFFALRPLVAPRLPVDGGVFPQDAAPPVLLAAGVFVGLPLLVALASAWGARRLRMDPLGVVRRVSGRRPRLVGLAPLGLGGVMVAMVAVAGQHRPEDDQLLGVVAIVAFVLLLVGLYAAAPLCCWLAARAVARLDLGPTARLVARRAEASPGATARVVSAVTLAVFTATCVLAFLPFAGGTETTTDLTSLRDRIGGGTFIASIDVRTPAPALPEARAFVTLRQAMLRPATRPDPFQVSIGDCTALAGVLGESLPGCAKGAAGVYLLEPAEPDVAAALAGPVTARILTPGPESAQGISYREVAVLTLPAATPGGLRGLGQLPLGGALISPATTPHLEGVGDSQLVLAVPASPNQVEPLRTRLAMAQGSVTTAVTTIDEQLADARQSSDMIRRAITAALVLATLIAAVSLVVTLLDRMLAGGRSLAALRAAGLPLAVLRRAALGETALVVVPAVMLGVLVAAPCAAALLTVDGTGSLSVDWRTAGLVGGAAVSLVLAVNLLLLPAVKHVATTTVLADD